MDAWSGLAQRSLHHGPHRGRRPHDAAVAPSLASALVAARFLPVWIATAVLAAVAAVIAPDALQSTSWAFVLPYMTILAIAALGQMLVVMQAGIDLSTPGVISFGGNLIVGVAASSNDRLALGDPRLRRPRRARRSRQRRPRRDRPGSTR